MSRLLLCLAMSSCATQGQAIPVYMTHEMPEHRELVEEAAAILGYPVEWSSRQYGSIYVDLVEQGSEHVAGRYWEAGPCRSFVWAESRPVVIAHELGHALGLEHVHEAHNVMYKATAWPNVEDWQQERMDVGLRLLRACK